MLLLISSLRAAIELSLLSFIAQGALYVLCAGRHRENPVYQLFALLTRPALSASARILPNTASQPLQIGLCFGVLLLLWLILALAKLRLLL